MPPPFITSLTIDDFAVVRRKGAVYIDKSAFIREVLDGVDMLLITRPRRFGKTLNMSMLRYFFERSDEDRSDLFEDLAIWQDEAARAHFQRHPVISLTLKDVKASTFELMLDNIARLLIAEARSHPELTRVSSPRDEATLAELRSGQPSRGACADALRALSSALAEHYAERVVLLIDEYDAPIERSMSAGYYDEAIAFFRGFLGGGLKGNPHIAKGVLTGVLRVSKESLFSDLNNLIVYTPLSTKYSAAFGFTEPEVTDLVARVGRIDQLDAIRQWYNGYRFGGETIYNPWSVLCYLHDTSTQPRAYWVSTGEHSLIHRMFAAGGPGGIADHEALLRGESIRKRLSDQLALRDLFSSEAAIWSLLLFSGYLTGEAYFEGDGWRADLRIPNHEVRGVYIATFQRWFETGPRGQQIADDLTEALLAGRAEDIEYLLGYIVLHHFSHHDLPQSAGESIYHAFVLGLLVRLDETHIVRSNRETGFGRADVMIRPRDGKGPGVVIEIKSLGALSRHTPEQALDAALKQIDDRDYPAELRAEGIDPIHRLAIVFEGKRVYVRAG